MNAVRMAHVSRILLGSGFVVFGVNGFLNVIPLPEFSPDAATFFSAIQHTGYLWPLLKGVEIVAGGMLLAGVMVPLALTLLAPGIVNMVLFHLFLDPANIGPALVLMLLELAVVYFYRDAYAGVLNPKARPAGS